MEHIEHNNTILSIFAEDKDKEIFIRNYRSGETIKDIKVSIRSKEVPFINRIKEVFNYLFRYKKLYYYDGILTASNSPALLEIITKLNAKGNLLTHAVKELQLAGYKDTYKGVILYKQIIELLAVCKVHDNYGYRSPECIDTFVKLFNFELISPLTLKEDEWNDVELNMKQNKRCTNIFKDYTGIYDINAFNKSIKSSRYFGSNKIVRNNNKNIFITGTIFESKDGIATGRGFKRVYFKEENIKEGLTPYKTINIPVTEIEVKKDDWLMFVDSKSTTLRQLSNLYNIDWFTNDLMAGIPIIEMDNNYGY